MIISTFRNFQSMPALFETKEEKKKGLIHNKGNQKGISFKEKMISSCRGCQSRGEEGSKSFSHEHISRREPLSSSISPEELLITAVATTKFSQMATSNYL
jgi:hypothetical protein